MLICLECDNDEFSEEDDGYFYCKLCGTRLADIISTGDDVDGTYQRKHSRPLPPVPPPEPDPVKRDRDYYKEMRERYTNGLIMMVAYQCDALVEKFYVTPLIIGLVGPICLRFLALSGVFDDGAADKAILDSEIQSNEEVREPEVKRRKGQEEEAHNLDGAPTLPTDMVRWAREGKIPYLSSFHKIREEMGETSAACPVPASVMFRPSEIVSAQRLEAQAASIAHVIGLPLPPVNFYAIASNYLKRLAIHEDKALLDLARLIQTWSMPSELYLSMNELRLPTRVYVMAIVIVAIRIHYYMNGFGVWERSLDDTEADAKLSDLPTEELLKHLETKYHELAAETLEYEKDLFSYLSHGRNEMCTGLAEASADDTYKTADKLWNNYPNVQKFGRLETLSKRGRDWEDVNQMSLDDLKLRDGNHPCTSHSSMDCDEPSLKSPDNHSYQEESKDIKLRKLITDMAENLFSYLPPRDKVKKLDYLQYVRIEDDGAMIYAADADYFILLRVCALVAEIDTRNMHRAVLSFERRLEWIEKRIDNVLHLPPPSIVSRDTKDTCG
ncbi:TATA box-binding protein-associated factor RNA polymerase I subunit B [Cardamine amara subsp. amara]|uniref:TATA box-binding protein-associated factor RNA polymerase I subunit B n=1 Tax=Cardamine amara subsp. amara TaxID=228776 RepID=A0ABD0ZLS0_CARAN